MIWSWVWCCVIDHESDSDLGSVGFVFLLPRHRACSHSQSRDSIIQLKYWRQTRASKTDSSDVSMSIFIISLEPHSQDWMTKMKKSCMTSILAGGCLEVGVMRIGHLRQRYKRVCLALQLCKQSFYSDRSIFAAAQLLQIDLITVLIAFRQNKQVIHQVSILYLVFIWLYSM